MPRYIDVNKLTDDVIKSKNDNPHSNSIQRQMHIHEHRYFLTMLAKAPTANVIEVPETGIGDLSDGYHTFNELYHHRAVLFSVICNMFPDKAWKSKLHDTGDMFEGMFIVGIETPEGQATYHYDIDPYWDMFKVRELKNAPTWDGHTPAEAIKRISTLHMTGKQATWRLETDEEEPNPMFKMVICSNCDKAANTTYKFCPNCGCVMIGLTTEGVNFG